MKNDSKARDIFYGVVAIATLIVAMIGATLAYFSITAGSNEGAINAQAATVSIEYKDGQQVSMQADALIPADFEVVKQSYNTYIKNLERETDEETGEILGEEPTKNECIDINGKQVCSVYRFSIASDFPRDINAYLKNEHNGFTYLRYAVYDVTNEKWILLDETKKDDYDNDYGETLKLSRCDGEIDGKDDDCKKEVEDQSGNTIDDYQPFSVNSLFGYTDGEVITKNVADVQTYDVVIFIRNEDFNQNIDQAEKYQGTIVIDVIGSEDTGGIDKIQGTW